MLSDWQMSCRTHDKGHTLYHHGGLAQPTRLVFLLVRGQGQDQPLPFADPGLSLPAPLWLTILANFRCGFPDHGIPLFPCQPHPPSFHGLCNMRYQVSSLHPTPWACVGPVWLLIPGVPSLVWRYFLPWVSMAWLSWHPSSF